MRGRKAGMALLALLPHLRSGPKIVHAVAGRAVRGFHLGSRHDELAVLAFEELLLLAGMASATERRRFVRRGDTVRWRRSGGRPVFDARPVARVAAQSFLEMCVGLEI